MNMNDDSYLVTPDFSNTKIFMLPASPGFQSKPHGYIRACSCAHVFPAVTIQIHTHKISSTDEEETLSVKPAAVILTIRAPGVLFRVYTSIWIHKEEQGMGSYATDENVKRFQQLPRALLRNGISVVHSGFIYCHQINKISSREAQILTTRGLFFCKYLC